MRFVRSVRLAASLYIAAAAVACADPGPSAPAPLLTTSTSVPGTLRVETPGLPSTAGSGGMVRLRPCGATSCPWNLAVQYPQFALSASGATDISVPVGSYAVDFFPPNGYEYVGFVTGETMGVIVSATSRATVAFAVAPLGGH